MTSASIWATTSGVPDGAHVVLVHGTLDRSAGMLRLARRLGERYLVSRYDRRGYGRSMPHGGPFAIDDQVDDLMGVIDRAPRAGEACVVFGHSYGGHVALAAAQRHPQRIAAVAVYESPLAWLPWWPSTTAGGDATSRAADPADAAERFMRRLFGDERWERLPPATRAARRAEGPALMGELTDIRANTPWDPESIDAPVLAMRGERGQEHHQRGTALLGEWFGSEVITIAGANHFGPNTHPGEVAEAVSALVTASLRKTEDVRPGRRSAPMRRRPPTTSSGR